MATIQFKGNSIHTSGTLPAKGRTAPDFELTDKGLEEKPLRDFSGQNLVLNIFPSINTGVCATSVRKFNEKAAGLDNTRVLCISKDLPFAQAQFCGAEGIENVEMLSDFRTDFGRRYGVEMTDGPLRGLLSRAVVVLNPEGEVIHAEQVADIGQEPDYAAALSVVNS